MKGGRSILAFLAVVIILAAASTQAQDEYQMPIKQVVSTASVVPVVTNVTYVNVIYTFTTPVAMSAKFEPVDASHVKLTVKPVIAYTFSFLLGWSGFPPNELDFSGGGSASYILDTETGYAEK